MIDADPHLMTLFTTALDRGCDADRATYLAGACGDTAIRERVEALLRAHQAAAAGFLERPSPTPPEPVSAAGDLIGGRYRLFERLGEGGMGEVWLAVQTEPVRRQVAVKLIKPGMDSRRVLARFDAERQALAVMDHPNIARVLDAGTTPAGRPYFVMELVRGVSITTYCDAHRLPVRERLGLFVDVCRAVQHAHQKGVMHRDLKPSNILVAEVDGRPVPKVIDFGLAKAVGEPPADRTQFTGLGTIVGTPEYMSPEQAELTNADIDTRTDVYSLGVLLYELLAGSPPFTRQELEAVGVLEMLRAIREREPARPSARLGVADGLPTLAANRGTEPKKLTAAVRGELDWITMKALEKDRGRRYESAGALAEDVQRYLSAEPVAAGPPSRLYRFRTFARRNRRTMLAAAASVLVLVAAVVGLTISNRRIAHETAQKDAALGELSAVNAQITEEKNHTVAALAEARAHQRLARQAIDEMHYRVGVQLYAHGHMRPLQRELMRKTLQFYEDFARRSWSDPAGRFECLQAALRVVVIRYEQGEGGQTEQACRDIIAAIRQLVDHDPSQPDRIQTLAEAHSRLGIVRAQAGRRDDAAENYQRAVELLRRLVEEYPAVPVYRYQLATYLNGSGGHLGDRPQEAAACHREAIRLYDQLLADHPADPNYRGELVRTHYLLGQLLARMGRGSLAETAFRQAIHVYETASASLDDGAHVVLLPLAKRELGGVLQQDGQTREAEAAYREAVVLFEKLVDLTPDLLPHQQNLLPTYMGLALLLVRTDRQGEAARFSGRAVDLAEKLAARIEDPQARCHALSDLIHVGRTLRDAGEYTGAELASGKAVGLARQLADKSPDSLRLLVEAHRILVDVLQRTGRLRAAAGETRERIAAFEQFTLAKPEHQLDLFSWYLELAVLMAGADKPDEAERCRHLAVGLGKTLVAKADPRSPLNDVAKLLDLGSSLCNAREFDGSEQIFRGVIGLLRERVEGSEEGLRLLARAHYSLGDLLDGRGRHPEAAAEYCEALAGTKTVHSADLEHTFQRAREANRLAITTLREAPGAIESVIGVHTQTIRISVQLSARYPDRLDFQVLLARSQAALGRTLSAADRCGEADVAIRQAAATIARVKHPRADSLDPREVAAVHNDIAWLLSGCPKPQPGDRQTAVKAAKIAVDLNPRANHSNTLGVALYRDGQFKEAIAALTKAVELGKGNSFDWFFLAMAYRQLGELTKAWECYDKAIDWMEKHQPKSQDLLRFRSEAEEVLRPADGSRKQTNPK
jgi:serine/threonine protein kinase/Tfp pilus assembly protein PilF